jgi:hypothetical protein
MILSARRTSLDGDVLDLPPWIRAPVYMNQGQTVYVTLDPEALAGAGPSRSKVSSLPLDSRFLELVISPFVPDIWGDLWRLKMETYDRPGNLNRIFEVLARRDLEVLMSEGSTNSNGRRHEMMFVLSARKYKSESDPKDTNARASQPTATLRDLQDELAIELMDVLTLYGDGRPRINMRRMRTYHSLYTRFSSDKIRRPVPVEVQSKGRIVLPKRFSHEIRRNLNQRPTATLNFSPAVDTTDRIVRLMCFAHASRSPCYAQIVVPRRSNMVAEIFKRIANPHNEGGAAINVVRYQLRPGLGRYAKRRETTPDDCDFMRLDLTFVPMLPESEASIFARLQESLSKIPDFALSGSQLTLVEGARGGGQRDVSKSVTKARVSAAKGAASGKPPRTQKRRQRRAN